MWDDWISFDVYLYQNVPVRFVTNAISALAGVMYLTVGMALLRKWTS